MNHKLQLSKNMLYAYAGTNPFAFFFLNDPAPPELSPLPLHAALPIFLPPARPRSRAPAVDRGRARVPAAVPVAGEPARAARRRELRREPDARVPVHAHAPAAPRSEEHTSELQSQSNLVCRLLLEKKKH